MGGVGVEATGRRDEFAGQFHAGEHLAPGFRVVAGGSQNGGDALRDRAVVQEAQDGLPMRGVQGSGREAGQEGRISFREPVETRDALLGKQEVIAENGGLGTQRMPGGQ